MDLTRQELQDHASKALVALGAAHFSLTKACLELAPREQEWAWIEALRAQQKIENLQVSLNNEYGVLTESDLEPDLEPALEPYSPVNSGDPRQKNVAMLGFEA